MTKDYYKILGISYPSSPAEIDRAYREMAKKWHPDVNPGQDVVERMKDINEAAEVLRDLAKKARYDSEYEEAFGSRWCASGQSDSYENADYNVRDEDLRDDIKEARKNAEEYVKQFFSEMKNAGGAAARGAWDAVKPFVIIMLVSLAAVACIKFCSGFVDGWKWARGYESESADIVSVDNVNIADFVADGWREYRVGNAFSISVPPSMEMRNDYDKYVKKLQSAGVNVTTDDLVFEPKGIADMDTTALQRYSRIIIHREIGSSGDFIRRNETPSLTYSDKEFFQEMVETECDPYGLISGPHYEWLRLSGDIQALEIRYRRNGTKGSVACAIYFLFNDDRAAKIMISYRESEKEMWLPDLRNVINTFKWLEK